MADLERLRKRWGLPSGTNALVLRFHDAAYYLAAYRGELVGPGMDLGPPFGAPTSWDDFGKEKILLLDSYRPERLPAAGDWVLVLENRK